MVVLIIKLFQCLTRIPLTPRPVRVGGATPRHLFTELRRKCWGLCLSPRERFGWSVPAPVSPG